MRRFLWSSLTLLIVATSWVSYIKAEDTGLHRKGSSTHTNHWAVIVDASRFWFNYRHSANALSIYRTVKRLGIPDSNIILMLADDAACNPRNFKPGTVNNDPDNPIDLYGDSVEVDYRGYEVSVENFLRVLTGRHEEGTPRSKQLLSDEGSNILIYMTGHGGEEFLKFQDAEEISSMDIADAFKQMWQKKRYNEIFFMIDTCQAGSMQRQFASPNILFVGSSHVGQNSYAFTTDRGSGVPVIDRFTYSALQVLERVTPDSLRTLADLRNSLDPRFIQSDPEWRTDLFARPLSNVLITDFFGSALHVQVGVPEISAISETASESSSNPPPPQSHYWKLATQTISNLDSKKETRREVDPSVKFSGVSTLDTALSSLTFLLLSFFVFKIL